MRKPHETHDELRVWMEARCLIEDIQTDGIKHIAGGVTVVGRPLATKIMKALVGGGFDVRRTHDPDHIEMPGNPPRK